MSRPLCTWNRVHQLNLHQKVNQEIKKERKKGRKEEKKEILGRRKRRKLRIRRNNAGRKERELGTTTPTTTWQHHAEQEEENNSTNNEKFPPNGFCVTLFDCQDKKNCLKQGWQNNSYTCREEAATYKTKFSFPSFAHLRCVFFHSKNGRCRRKAASRKLNMKIQHYTTIQSAMSTKSSCKPFKPCRVCKQQLISQNRSSTCVPARLFPPSKQETIRQAENMTKNVNTKSTSRI